MRLISNLSFVRGRAVSKGTYRAFNRLQPAYRKLGALREYNLKLTMGRNRGHEEGTIPQYGNWEHLQGTHSILGNSCRFQGFGRPTQYSDLQPVIRPANSTLRLLRCSNLFQQWQGDKRKCDLEVWVASRRDDRCKCIRIRFAV